MFENVNPKEQSTETSRENVEFSEKNDERTFKVENDDSFIFAEIEDLPPIEDFDIEDKIEPFLDIDEWPPLESIEECDILIAPVSEVEPFPLADSPKSFLAEKSDDNETKTDKPIIKITDENRKNPEPNTIYVGENGAIYETDGKGRVIKCIFKPELVDDVKDLKRTGFIHIAFSVGSKEKVDELTEILKIDGYEVISGPRTTGDGYYESCIVGIEENQIEITV